MSLIPEKNAMHDAKTHDLLRQVVIILSLSRTVCKFQAVKELQQTSHSFRNVSRMSFTVLNFLRFSFCGSTWKPEDY